MTTTTLADPDDRPPGAETIPAELDALAEQRGAEYAAHRQADRELRTELAARRHAGKRLQHAHRSGDHTRCRPAWCLVARQPQSTPRQGGHDDA